MKPEPDKRLSLPSPFITAFLIQEICHNLREVQVNDVERDGTVDICRGKV